MIEVKIIFFGLIAFVPQENQISALLVDGTSHGSVSQHDASVWLLKGGCKGGEGNSDCYRTTPSSWNPSEKVFKEQYRTPFKLIWLLDKEELRFGWMDGDELKSGLPLRSSPFTYVDDARGANENGLFKFPRTSQQARDISWIPDLSRITPQAPPVKSSCFGDADDCPLISRISLGQGTVESCRMVNKRQSWGPTDYLLAAYRYRPWGSAKDSRVGNVYYEQAVADAVSVSMQVPASSLKLLSTSFSSETPNAQVDLTPDESGRVTLLISNSAYFSEPHEVDHVVDTRPSGHRHFELYYGLLDSRDSEADRPVPYVADVAVSKHAGSCATDLADWVATIFDSDDEPNRWDCESLRVERPRPE